MYVVYLNIYGIDEMESSSQFKNVDNYELINNIKLVLIYNKKKV